MFGLEEKKPDEPKAQFDLEKEIQDPKMGKELKERVEKRISALKQTLRSGENQEEFDEYGVLLHAFAALQKLMNRVAKR